MHGGQNTESYTLLCTKKLERMQASDKLMPACTHAETFKGNAQFVKNTTFGLWGKKMIAQPQKMFCKIPMNARATISVMSLS